MDIDTFSDWFYKYNDANESNMIEGYNNHVRYVFYGLMWDAEAVANYILCFFITLELIFFTVIKKVSFKIPLIFLMLFILSFPYYLGYVLLGFNIYFIVLLWYIYNDKLLKNSKR